MTGPTSLGDPSVEGLDPNDFQVYVGSEDAANRADVVSGAYVQGQYWLVAQAPKKAANGTFPLRVRLNEATVATEESAVIYEKLILDQMLVIDRSGSMLSPAGSPKLDAAKNAAGLFVDSARSDDKLGVVSFGGDNVEPNDDATTLRNLQPVNDANRTAARTAIAGISTVPSVADVDRRWYEKGRSTLPCLRQSHGRRLDRSDERRYGERSALLERSHGSQARSSPQASRSIQLPLVR